jgi:hypothetical protein
MTVGEFWELTPRETTVALQAAVWRLERARERDLALAWHIVALDRTKRLPTLKRLLRPGTTRRLAGDEKTRRAAEFRELAERMG